MRYDLLKTILKIPTRYKQEDAIVQFLEEYAFKNHYHAEVDKYKNVFIHKGDKINRPLICAHTDTVHSIHPENIPEQIIENDHGDLIALKKKGTQTGIGGDDKAGIFICLELLEHFKDISVVFFATEEIGCVGAHGASKHHYNDIGYAIEFDSPEDNIMSYSNNGINNFEDNGDFIKLISPILNSHGVTRWEKHPYTDIHVIRKVTKLSCLNLPAGYFNYHTPYEYVRPKAVENSIKLGINIINTLGYQKYMFEHNHLNNSLFY